MMSAFFEFQHILNRLFNNCIKFYWSWITSSWNMKGGGRGSNWHPPHPPGKTTFKKSSLIRVKRYSLSFHISLTSATIKRKHHNTTLHEKKQQPRTWQKTKLCIRDSFNIPLISCKKHWPTHLLNFSSF